MQLVSGLQSGTTGTTLPIAVDASGHVMLAGYDVADEATVIKSMQKKFRDSFGGASVSAAKWDVTLGTGMTATVSGGVLSFASGTNINTEGFLLSKETFTIPMRSTLAVTLSQRIANQEFWFELVSVDPATGLPDNQNTCAWSFDGTTVTTAKYVVQNSGVTALISPGSTVPTSAGGSIYELEPFADETWFHGGTLDSATARANSYRRHQQSPDPNAVYKLRLRWKNLGTAPASSTTASIQYVVVTDYAELTAEITAGRGQASAGQALGVVVTGGTVGTTETTLVTPATAQLNSAATTNATSVKASAGNIYGIFITNLGASAVYLKLYNKASAPTVGTDIPVQTIMVAANSDKQIETGRVGLRLSTGVAYAITGAAAVADTTAVAAGQVQLSISYV